jgi:murein DD-endopeptidase MepM/ murein hydrolase activator NlpD
MQNSGKFYTFLISRSSRSRIFIRRIEISKKIVQNGLLSAALITVLSLFTIGVAGVYNYALSNGSNLASNGTNPALSQLSAPATQDRSIDYSRPEDSGYTFNSGGPENQEADAEDVEIEKQLTAIEKSSDPAFVPSIWAHAGKINNEFGFRRSPFGGRNYEFHAGMDIDGERGDAVVAPANGTITEAGWKGGYGQMIEIDHGNGLITRYGHLSRIEVEVGQQVSRGQEMGLVGSTGRSTGPHLHYELRVNNRPINPRRFLPPEPTELKKVNG